MGENWVTLLEHHVTFGGVCTLLIAGARYWLKERDILKRVKSRLNTLWWERCAKHQEPYVPVENGIPAVVPPRPDGD